MSSLFLAENYCVLRKYRDKYKLVVIAGYNPNKSMTGTNLQAMKKSWKTACHALGIRYLNMLTAMIGNTSLP